MNSDILRGETVRLAFVHAMLDPKFLHEQILEVEQASLALTKDVVIELRH